MRRLAARGLLLKWRSGGTAPTLCAWFRQGGLTSMAGRAHVVFSNRVVYILGPPRRVRVDLLTPRDAGEEAEGRVRPFPLLKQDYVSTFSLTGPVACPSVTCTDHPGLGGLRD